MTARDVLENALALVGLALLAWGLVAALDAILGGY